MAHSSKSLPPLDSLRAFEAAARAGSLSAAAGDLNLTHGAVSRQIAKLEAWLGFRVFDRQARGVSLTLEGKRLFMRTAEAFDLLADNTDRWSEPRGGMVVRLATIPSIAGLWIMRRLRDFEIGPPSLRIVLNVDIRQNDLAEEGIDLSIRCGRGGIPGRVSLELFQEMLFPVASPEVAKALSEQSVEQMLRFPLIHDSDAAPWRAWLQSVGLDYVPRAQDRRFEDYNLVLEAAAAGLGVALARPPLAAAQIAEGRLVQVDTRTVRNPVSYWMDRPVGPMRPAAIELARRVVASAQVAETDLARFLEAER